MDPIFKRNASAPGSSPDSVYRTLLTDPARLVKKWSTVCKVVILYQTIIKGSKKVWAKDKINFLRNNTYYKFYSCKNLL